MDEKTLKDFLDQPDLVLLADFKYGNEGMGNFLEFMRQVRAEHNKPNKQAIEGWVADRDSKPPNQTDKASIFVKNWDGGTVDKIVVPVTELAKALDKAHTEGNYLEVYKNEK